MFRDLAHLQEMTSLRAISAVYTIEEKMGIRTYYETESRILPATEAELAQQAEFNLLENSEEVRQCIQYLAVYTPDNIPQLECTAVVF